MQGTQEDAMFERFTDRARRVVVLAQEESRMLGHNYIGTEHLLLGLIHEGEGVAAMALTSMGISLTAVRSQVEEIIGQGQAAPTGHIPFTPRAKKVLELSLREALQLGHNYIGTEHILLGLIREGEGVASQVLHHLGADLNGVRKQVMALLASGSPGGGVAPPQMETESFRSTPFGEPPERRLAERRERLARIEELAAEEARALGHDQVEAAHRWLGYVRIQVEEAEADLDHLRRILDDGRRRVAEQAQAEKRDRP
jgi:ATP-dependent Clp protease ATP-binding subunit ClpA